MLTVYIDFKSPACYLAMQPALALIARYDLTVDWQPFQTFERDVPPPPEASAATESVGEVHRRVRAASRRATHQKYAQLQGIDLRFPPATGATDAALGALAVISGDPLPFIHAAFAAYWTDHANLDDPAVVRHLLAATSGDSFNSAPQDWPEALTTAQSIAEERGVVDAPAILIADQLFIGREHLPWIEEIVRNTSNEALSG